MNSKKVIFLGFILLLCSAMILSVATMMWFSMNKNVESGGISLKTMDVPKISYTLYIYNDELKVWEEKNQLVLPDKIVPNQSAQCKIVIKNDGLQACNVAIDFLKVTNGETDINKISDVLEFVANKIESPIDAEFVADATFTDLMGNNNFFRILKNCKIESKSEAAILFDIKMKTDADNKYGSASINIGEIIITASVSVDD